MWMKRDDGNYVNIDTGISMVASGSGSSWAVKVGANVGLNAGTFASQAEAQEAIRVLTRGVDPADLI